MADPLVALRRIATRRRRLAEQLADLDRERDDEIRTLLAARTNTVHEIAEVAGLSWQRIYQIRDGRR